MLFAQYRNTQRLNKNFFAIFSCFFFPFSKRKGFLPLLFLKFQGSIDSTFLVTETYHQYEPRLEKKIICVEIKNLLLRIIHFTNDIYSLKINNENRTICEICSKLKIKTLEWSQWGLGLNFIHLRKNFIYIHCCFHPFEWPKPSAINSNIVKYSVQHNVR